MSDLRGNFSIIPKEAWGGMDISSTYFNILFLFLTKANNENIPNVIAESLPKLESIKLKCYESNLICLFVYVKVIQLTYTQTTLEWTLL
jgi:hypothetical protein